MEIKIGNKIRLVIYLIVFLICAFISANLVGDTYRYDPAWAAFIYFIFIGIPFIVGGTLFIAHIIFNEKVRLRYELLISIVIIILMIVVYSTQIK